MAGILVSIRRLAFLFVAVFTNVCAADQVEWDLSGWDLDELNSAQGQEFDVFGDGSLTATFRTYLINSDGSQAGLDTDLLPRKSGFNVTKKNKKSDRFIEIALSTPVELSVWTGGANGKERISFTGAGFTAGDVSGVSYTQVDATTWQGRTGSVGGRRRAASQWFNSVGMIQNFTIQNDPTTTQLPQTFKFQSQVVSLPEPGSYITSLVVFLMSAFSFRIRT